MASIVQQTVSLSLCKIQSQWSWYPILVKKDENGIIEVSFCLELDTLSEKEILNASKTISNPQIYLNLQRPIVGINLDFFGCTLLKTA